MNWFTNVPVSHRKDGDDECEHVMEGAEPVMIMRENDSFGPVGGMVVCQECWDKAKESEAEETHVCHDCGKEFPLKDGIAWRPYYFDVTQGDEPLHICNDCKVKPKHVERKRRDREDYLREMDDY